MGQKVYLANIKTFVQRRHITLSDLAEKIGMTYVGLAKIIRENTTTLHTLLNIANALNVPVQVFFLEESHLANSIDFSLESYLDIKKENEALKAEISELKNKIIRLADKL